MVGRDIVKRHLPASKQQGGLEKCRDRQSRCPPAPAYMEAHAHLEALHKPGETVWVSVVLVWCAGILLTATCAGTSLIATCLILDNAARAQLMPSGPGLSHTP